MILLNGLPTMVSGTLTVNSKLSPFPYAAVALATHIGPGSVDVVWQEDKGDEELVLSTTAVLSIDGDGTPVTDDGKILDRLVEVSGLSEDSEKVCSYICYSC